MDDFELDETLDDIIGEDYPDAIDKNKRRS